MAEVPPLDHEAIAENNRVPFQVVPRDPKIRVIYMEGTAGGGQMNAEYRWIRNALIEDPNIECVALEVDNQYNARPRLYRVDDRSKGFPTTREELFSYDVVIVSDIARAAFTPEQIAWTVELVQDRGGGFAMIGGHTSFGSGGWDQTAWDGLIPVDMSGRGPGGRQFFDGPFRVVVPPGAESHPIWHIAEDPERNRQILARMPAFHGTNLTDRLKPGATVLGVSDQPLAGAGVIPIFSSQAFGRGRTFAMATDSTYAWGIEFERDWGEGDNRYFRKFWRNVVQWLAENASGANRRLRVDTDKVVYRPGRPIQVTARAYDDRLEETDRYRLAARLLVPVPDGPPQPVAGKAASLSPRVDDTLYQGELLAPAMREIPGDPGSPVRPVRPGGERLRRRPRGGPDDARPASAGRPGRIPRPPPRPGPARRARPRLGRRGRPRPRRPGPAARPACRRAGSRRAHPFAALGPAARLGPPARPALGRVDRPASAGSGLSGRMDPGER